MLRMPFAYRAPADAGGAAPAAAPAASPAGGAATPAAAAPAAAAPAGSAQVPFAETLPEDIRGEAVFRDIKDLAGLARSYHSAAKMIGGRPQDLIKVPGPDDAEGHAVVWEKLGRPADAKGYELPDPKLPEGVAVDTALRDGFAGKAHELGLTKKQAGALYDWWNTSMGGMATARTQAMTQANEAAVQGLAQEWGAAKDERLADAKAAVQHYGGEDVLTTLETVRTADGVLLGNLPQLAKVFANLGKQLREDGLVGRGGGDAAMSPAEAQQEINALNADKQFMAAYVNKHAPGHADAVAKMTRLYAFRHPGTPGR